MPYEYNPLLKDCLQKDSTASIQADISALQAQLSDLQSRLNALQTNKITKCFSQSDFANLESGEIFEWQGENSVIENTDFIQGFFYKKTIGQQTLPIGTKYLLYEDGFPTININNYVFAPDKYYLLNIITPDNSSNFYNYTLVKWNGNNRYYFINIIGGSLQVGGLVWDNQEIKFLTVTNIDEFLNYTLSNGDILNGATTGGHFAEIYECKNANGTEYIIIRTNLGRIVAHYTLVDNVFTLIDWFFVYVVTRTTTEPASIGFDTYSQTDTQPRILGVSNNTDGDITISNNVELSGNITVKGTQTIVDTQEIDSENDFINMRVNNPLALADGNYSGLSVKNYDGNGNNLDLVVDNTGWARVGDETGTLQKLATIEENPTNGAFVAYNTTTKQLESKSIPEYTLPTASASVLGGVKVGSNLSISNGVLSATDTTYSAATQSANGLMSAADKKKLDGIAAGANAYTLPTASASVLGGVKVGSNLSISNGVLSATNTTYSAATQSANGLMSATDKKKLDGISAGANAYSLPTASASTLGGVKVGNYLTISSGVLAVNTGYIQLKNFVNTATFTNGNSTCQCWRFGRVVFVGIKLVGTTIVTIGNGYRPISNITGILGITTDSSSSGVISNENNYIISILSTGAAQVKYTGAAGKTIYGYATYICHDYAL